MVQANNFTNNEAATKPYSNYAPSTGTRSNATIDRSGSVGYGKVKSQLQNPSSIMSIEGRKSNSKKMIGTANEYEDDSILTLNSNNYGKRSNLNTIIGAKSNNENELTLAMYKNKLSNKDLTQKQKVTKIAKKEGIRSKSNKRTNQEIFERVYMQSPIKLINRKPLNHSKLKKNINTYESEAIIKEKLAQLRDRSVSPNIPKIKETITNESRHKTAIKKRSDKDLSHSMKHDNSFISTNKDNSKINFVGLKNIVSDSHVFLERKRAGSDKRQSRPEHEPLWTCGELLFSHHD